MRLVHHILGLSLVTLLASVGCQPSEAELSGTWSNNTCFGTTSTPEGIKSCMVSLIFNDDLDISLEARWESMPATAINPGCLTTKRVTGQTWSTKSETDYDVLSVSGNGKATMERNECVNSEDELDKESTTGISIPSGDINYEVAGSVLTILTSDLQGTYEM